MYCRECGEKLSPNASACPSCGDQEEESHRGRKIAGAIIVILFVGIGFVLAFPEYIPIDMPDNPASAYAQEIRGYVQYEVVPKIPLPELQ